jgi:hypothetical protein
MQEAENSGGATELEQGGGEEGDDMWGPHVSDRRERKRRGWKAQTEGESAFT